MTGELHPTKNRVRGGLGHGMTVSSELVLVRPLPETAMGMLFNTVYNCLLGALPKKNNITLGDTSIPRVQS